MAAIVVTITVVTAAAVTTLWWVGTQGLTGADLSTARFNAVKIGLSIGVGSGGVFAIYLAWRRQKSTEIGLHQKAQDQADVARAYALQERIATETQAHQEKVAAATEKDASERRITELYTKSADQLGSDKAAVRLAGLYALERLGQNEEDQREIILNVVCSYLRMPSPTPPDALPDDADAAQREQHGQQLTAHTQERQVRRTAQRIIRLHRERGLGTYWATFISIDLTDADLIYTDLSDTDLTGAKLGGAHLTNANLAAAGLIFANLTYAELAYADLHFAQLNDALLIAADLSNARLARAILTHANLTGAILTHANVTGACLGDANLTDANLTDANLTDANLTDANLTNANLTNANLTNANLTNANLTGANLTNADLTGANLTGANLTGANLTNADLTNADLTGVDRSRVNWSAALNVPSLSDAPDHA